jgi:hypothetical protein
MELGVFFHYLEEITIISKNFPFWENNYPHLIRDGKKKPNIALWVWTLGKTSGAHTVVRAFNGKVSV